MSDILIKTLHKISDFDACIELQKDIWRLKDYKDCIPNHILMAISESGGLVLGGYLGDRLAGFSIILPAHNENDGFYHHSHILGIHPDLQHRGFGLKFKQEHYKKALAAGVKKVTWTYDPLLGPNASLNIAKLGGIARKYNLDVYGNLMGGSDLVSGIPSDRFWLEWYITTDRVAEKMGDKISVKENVIPVPLNTANEVIGAEPVSQRMKSFDPDPSSNRILLEMPSDFQAIYDTNRDAALDWRLKTRNMFLEYFKAGYIVVDFFKEPTGNTRRNFYVLDKDYNVS